MPEGLDDDVDRPTLGRLLGSALRLGVRDDEEPVTGVLGLFVGTSTVRTFTLGFGRLLDTKARCLENMLAPPQNVKECGCDVM